MAKWMGELSEMKFQVRATENKLICSKPFGDLQTYDFIVDSGQVISRVQVKSTFCKLDGAYQISARHGNKQGKKRSYEKGSWEVLACYVKPYDAWYLIPESAVRRGTIRFYPHRSGVGRYEQYREDWEVLR